MSGQGEITVEDLLAEIAPRVERARIMLRQDLVDEHARLDAELQAAIAADSRADGSIDEGPTSPAIAQRILDFEAEYEAAKREFVFQALGHRKWADLMAQHPPTAEQKKVNRFADHNPLEFPRHAIAASCISPKMTLAQVIQFEDMLDEARWGQLYQACLLANVGGGPDPKSALAGALARTNAELGLPPAGSEFPDLSSLDG